ncbi:TonB-dependent receptor domain-containing protein [uncultured Parabacteroides sp.]|uniref:TonB-dependent receptor domain-containing protein n=2 Tax=uncultured Parabacteroides sp. TaxID=512312 RepID=UPI0035A66FC0
MKKFVLERWFTYAIVCLSCFLMSEKLSAEVNGGDEVRTVTLNMRDVSLKEILAEIEKQAGVTFSYESSLLKEFRTTSFKVEDAALDDCLARLFAGYPLVYKRTGNIVVLKRKPRQVTISGFVRDKTSAESLVGASVYDIGSRLGIATNAFGFFSLTIPASDDSLRISVSYIGYENRKLGFPALERDTMLTLFLQTNASIGEVVVTGNERSLRSPVHNVQMGALEVNQATIRATPALLGEADIIRTLQLTPGVSMGTEGVSGLYVRGGNADENLFLIDGNPVYQLNHLGGIFSAFNGEAVKSMDFYKAGFPARYGGRLSSVVDVQTKEGNMKEYHGSASLGLIAGNLSLEGPIVKDRTSFSIALRRTWFDVITAPALAIFNAVKKDKSYDFNFRYAFHDLNARVDHRVNDRSRLFVSIYNGNDVLKATSEDKPGKDGSISSYLDKTHVSMRWGNLVASAGWTYAFNNRLFGKIAGFYTRYNAKISYREEEKEWDYNNEAYSLSFDETVSASGINDFGVRTSFDYQPVSNHHIRFGGDYVRHDFRPEYNRFLTEESDQPDSMQIGKVFSNEKLLAHELSAFAEDDWTLTPALRLNAGVRLSLFNIDRKTYTGVEPRVSLRWLLGKDLSLKASYSRMNQYVHLISNSFLNLPTDSWMPVTRNLKPLISDQYSLGAYYNWKELDFSMEGYYKDSRNLLEYKDGHSLVPSSIAWDRKLAAGKGRSYGVEWMVRKPAGRTTGWIGYSLAWSDRRFDELNGGRRFPSRYDNRHKLNIVVMHKLSERVELSAAWTFTSGNYTTLSTENYEGLNPPSKDPYYGSSGQEEFDLYGDRNNYQLPAYHRLDLGINIYRPKKKGRMGIWNVSLYNAYCRMNPFMIEKTDEYDPAEMKSYPVFKQYSFLPIIPSVSYTYKF